MRPRRAIPKVDDRKRVLDVHAPRTTFGMLLSKGRVSLRTAQAARHGTDRGKRVKNAKHVHAKSLENTGDFALNGDDGHRVAFPNQEADGENRTRNPSFTKAVSHPSKRLNPQGLTNSDGANITRHILERAGQEPSALPGTDPAAAGTVSPPKPEANAPGVGLLETLNMLARLPLTDQERAEAVRRVLAESASAAGPVNGGQQT